MTELAAVSRGRGRAPDPRRTARSRSAILRSALAIFLERGFEGARMADVAARAGLAKGTLYLHFADKDALFEFVLQELVSAPFARLRAETAPAGEGTRATLERIFLPMLRDFEPSGRAAVMRLIIAEGVRFPNLAAIHRRLVLDPMMDMLGEIVRRDVRSGSGRLAPLDRFPQLMGAPVIMAAVWNGLWATDTPVDPAEMFEAFLDLAFGPSQHPE